MEKSKTKKISGIVLNVLLYVFLAICIFSVILTVFSKRGSDGAVEILGYQMRLVTSESMAKCEHTDVSDYKIKDIPVRSMVFVELMPKDPEQADAWYRDLRVGDVLTFRYVYTTQVTITHRITAITEKETGGFLITLAGDNKDADNGQLSQVIDTSIPNNTNYVIGKVTGQAYLFGLIMSVLMNPIGIVLLIILPCIIIIVFEILKIVKVFGAEKRRQEQEELEKKNSELEALRQRLAQLEQDRGENHTASKEDAEDPVKTEKTE